MRRLGRATLSMVSVWMIAGATAATPLEGDAEWRLVWNDEFDGPAVDTSKWDVLTRRDSFNNELQYYRPQQASLVEGKLRITATNEPFDGKPYRSARLESRQAWAYGRFEVLAKVPTTKGIWPAAWLFPVNHPWPAGGEIDIVEHAGSQPTVVSSAYHWGASVQQHAWLSETHTAHDTNNQLINWSQDFHEYAAEWDPDRIRFYVDGVLHFEVRGWQADISNTPMNFVLNVAVGGDFDGNPDGTTAFPQHFDVEYVRVFERRPVPEPATAALLAAGIAAGAIRHRTRQPDAQP